MKFDCIEGECIILVQILKGEFRTEDYDFCVAHSDMEKALVPLKSVLKSRYPTWDNGEPLCLALSIMLSP